MTVAFGPKSGGQQVFPVDYEAEVSQRLVEASQRGDLKAVAECLGDPYVDVNYAGAVWLTGRVAEVVMSEEAPHEVRFRTEEIRTDVSALFLAAHNGEIELVRKLLSSGADVNQKLFRGFATTAAVREGQTEILELLLRSGASQPACEDALLEACCHGRAKIAELLMGSDLIRPQVAVHAFVTACTRGFVDVVDTLMKCGVDANATDRVLLQSLKPSLHANVDSTALIAAILSRQIATVQYLLEAGLRRDTKVSLGAWSWDTGTGEECRVGAGLAEPYDALWCSVEYFEATGAVLRMLLRNHSVNALYLGRALLHHAILCANPRAVSLLLDSGADCELPVKTTRRMAEFRPIHLAARLGFPEVLQTLIGAGCDVNSRAHTGETAAMLCARHKQGDSLKVLASAGADLGLVSLDGSSAATVAASNRWALGFQQSLLEVIRTPGQTVYSSDPTVFSPLMFAAECGDVGALESLLLNPQANIDEQDEKGCTPVMAAAREGHVDAFRVLVFLGANVNLRNRSGETAITLSRSNRNRDMFEKVMLEYALERGVAGGFYGLHYAARRGDMAAARLLTSKGYDVNMVDEDDYTPLMLAAREGHGTLCELLVSHGARCDVKTSRGETALSLARLNGSRGGVHNGAERVILDELARVLVLNGANVKKHTKGGRGSPHEKLLAMVSGLGVLRWGKSSRRNVVCREAEVGPSPAFQRNRKRKGDAGEPGLFKVVTTKNREVHFVCEGGHEAAELWVRGIRLVTREALGIGKEASE